MPRRHHLLFGVIATILAVARSSAADEDLNNGEDITKPVNRFDVRFQLKTLADAMQSGEILDHRHSETLTLRSDLKFLSKPGELALRFDLPLVWSNKPTAENTHGRSEFGFGDVLFQAAYVRTFTPRWAGAIGFQTIAPSASGDAFGNGKWRLVPSLALRTELPEISSGSYVGLIVRQDVSVAGDSARRNINDFIVEPQFNVNLPARWFLNSSPKLYYSTYSETWFVPLDLMVGKKFGRNWIASVEYQYGVVRDNYRYQHWVECRIGYLF